MDEQQYRYRRERMRMERPESSPLVDDWSKVRGINYIHNLLRLRDGSIIPFTDRDLPFPRLQSARQ